MAINFPTLKQIIERSRVDLRGVLPKLDPSKPKSFIRAIIDSNSGRAFDAVTLLKQVLNQLFPQTAEDEYLIMWGEYNNLELRPAQESTGVLIIQGTSAVEIPIDTLFNSVPGNQYKTKAAVTISAFMRSLASASADINKVVTCTTATAHDLATGLEIDFSGLTNSANTTGAAVTVLSSTSFSFVAPNVNTTGSVLGTGQYYFLGAKLEVESVEAGADKNLGSGSILSLVTPIPNVEAQGYVDFSGLLGGTDIESADSYRERILDRRANPVANFNIAAIKQQAFKIPSVTKVYVAEVTPYAGAVTVYFFVQDGSNMVSIPNASQVTDVKDSILDIKPVTIETSDVIVSAPNVISVTHTITSLSPNVSTMRSAIEENLKAFYEDETDLGLDITLDMIKNVIQNSQDLSTGSFPSAFTLTLPASTVVVNADEIAGFGSVSFA